MLIRFSVENFLSFRDEVELSMVAGKQRIHPEHLLADEKRGMSLLKTAVIYGANASGKSNLIKAMAFAKQQIVEGQRLRQAIPVKPFKLEVATESKPSRFEFEFNYRTKAYNYGFILDSQMIYEEWLYEITKSSEKAIFERAKSHITFSNIKFQNKDDKQFLDFVARGTRPNQLFLTESIEKNVSYFRDAYDWFDKVLTILSPETKVDGIEAQFISNEGFKQAFQDFFKLLDTGVSGIELYEFNLDEQQIVPHEVMNRIKEDVLASEVGEAVQVESGKGRYLIRKESPEEIRGYKLMTIHPVQRDSQEIRFDVSEESDGTQRLFDLIPALMDLLNGEKVFVVDELDRSLHPHLSRKILEVFLSSKSQSQLIVTTHESSLLDLELLRRDEIWFIEKDKNGVSQVYSLEEFAPRYDKDIRKGYLLGRFGAIPIIQNASIKEWAK